MAIPTKPKDQARYDACKADDCLWLRTYCAEVFYNPFTPHQEKIIRDCGEALRYGTLKCKAAPRGDGKSSVVKYLALKYALCRQVKFPLIVAATSSKAKKILGSLKRRLVNGAQFNAQNKTFRLASPLGEDYPLECCAAAYVDPWPSRARNATANGGRQIHVEWGADSLILPTWEDEEPLGPIMLSLGITSDELQGCNIYDQRPDFVMLDDLDSRDSLAAEDGVIAGKIEEAIDKTIAGLGGQSRRLGQFMLCTITSRDAAAYKYSDPTQKAAWSGERIAAIQVWPERTDLWEQYIELRKAGKNTLDNEGKPTDVFGRNAHQLYVDNFEEMNRGAVLANPYNYESDLLPDGTPKQLSALQRCYDYIADNGLESFQTEHQNDPPEASGPVESGITPFRICKQLSGFDRGTIPPGCFTVTMGVDVGKWYLHWVVRAWRQDGTGFTIDYGEKTVYGVERNTDDGLDFALKRALLSLFEEVRAKDYANDAGEVMPIQMAIVDSRYRTQVIYDTTEELGLGVMPVMGHGKSAGCVRSSFNDLMHRTKDRKPGDGWFQTKHKTSEGKTIWLVNADADRWKAWEHDRWMTPPARDKAGCMFAFGTGSGEPKSLAGDELEHKQYAKHICGEVEVEETVDGIVRRKWKPKGENHWLDASYYSDVAANMCGVRIGGKVAVAAKKVRRTTSYL